jgi:(p)ppGpp synthase/HD superfamily hydrolase
LQSLTQSKSCWPLRSIEEEREKRIAFITTPDKSVEREFTKAILSVEPAETRTNIEKAFEYAQSMDYNHPGQSKEIYLAHPLRVAILYMHFVKPADTEGTVTSLLHNVLEVSNVNRNKLASEVGINVANAIEMLSVDRKQQWEKKYKEWYYAQLAAGPRFVGTVKVLDKLDNLFLLCLNSSEKIRGMYLREIETWLIPLAEQTLPTIVNYLKDLVADNWRIGYRSSGLYGQGTNHRAERKERKNES